jgi:hypothetical protein
MVALLSSFLKRFVSLLRWKRRLEAGERTDALASAGFVCVIVAFGTFLKTNK